MTTQLCTPKLATRKESMISFDQPTAQVKEGEICMIKKAVLNATVDGTIRAKQTQNRSCKEKSVRFLMHTIINGQKDT